MKMLILAVVSVMALVSTGAQATVKAGGFGDAQLRSGYGSSTNSPTFGIMDGAVYINGESGNSSGMIDIPFVGGGATNAFTIGTNKAQLWMTHKYANGIFWTMGQFDKLLGYDHNDSRENFFADQSLLYTAGRQRFTHTGLVVGYKVGEQATLKFLVSNPNNQGQRNGSNFEYGAQVLFNAGGMTGRVGGLFYKTQGATPLTTYALDAGISAKVQQVLVDAQVDLVQYTSGSSGLDLIGQFVYEVTKEIGVGARAEYADKVLTSTDSTLQFTVGPNFKVWDSLNARLNYAYTTTSVAGTSTSTHGLVVSSVYTFN